MIRRLRAVALAVVLQIAVTACWLDVPNLQSTEGGYAPGGAGGDAPSATDPAEPPAAE